MAFGHLAPDRKGLLLAPRHLYLQPGLCQRLLDGERDRIDLPAFLFANLRKPARNGLVGIRLQMLERECLHLAHVFVHADPLCQRRVDIDRLARDPAALVLVLDEVERAHVVQPVAQLDEQHADILAHRQQELAQVFRRALVLGQRLDLRKLGHAVDQPGDLGPEIGLDIVDRGERILDRIVQQRGGDGLLVELEVGHQPGNLDRVAEIGIAARALLRAVLLHGIDIGVVEHRLVGVRVVGLDPLD